MKKALLIVSLLWLAPSAQAGGLGEFLDLSLEQGTELRVLRIHLEEAIAPLAREVEIRETILADELGDEDPNALAVGRLVVEISRLRARIHAVRGFARQEFVDVLSEEQQQRLDPLRLSAKLAAVAQQALYLNLIGPGDPLDDERD